MRYLIDYYDIAEKRGSDRVPALHEMSAVPSIGIDVRPAGDTPGEVADRIFAFGASCAAALSSTVRGVLAPAASAREDATGDAPPQAREREIPPPTPPPPAPAATSADAIRERCADKFAALGTCTDESACAAAHIALTMCVGEVVCADEARAFAAAKGTDDAERATSLYARVDECVARWAGSEAQSGDDGS